MELNGACVLVAGATGELGSRFSRELARAGARVALAGRGQERLGALADELDAPSYAFEARDAASCEAAVDAAARDLGRLDALVISTGVVAFGPSSQLSPAVATELFEVNVLGPIAMVRAALRHLGPQGAIVGLSAIVADYPTADMAAYSATKAALSAFLAAVRRERRRTGLTVLDVRPQHMGTGFSDRAVEGTPPVLPGPIDPDALVALVLDALRAGRREIAFDLSKRELVVR